MADRFTEKQGQYLAFIDSYMTMHGRARIAQGVEMGRPSTLMVRAEKSAGVVQATRVGGAAVLVSEGTIHLD